ncbi:uncharacterized protein LOC144430351 [Styela clava]
MKLFTSFFVMFYTFGCTYSLNCHSCTDTNFDGEAAETCFNTVSVTTTSATCTADSGTTVYYCRTKFRVHDGVTTGVVRGCAASTSDEDTHSDAVPTADRCITVLDATGNPTAATECYYHCTPDNCNTEKTASLKQCPNDCNSGASPRQGRCNYITGVCVCESGWSGTDCNTAVTSTSSGASRKCVQCNSEIDSGCSTSTTSVDCPGTEAYCSTRTSTIFDGSDAVIRTVTTKACTSDFKAVDQCVFNALHSDSPISDTSVGYSEFNCFSTCDTNDCNTNTADGVINGNEAVALQCVVCSDTSTCNTKTERQACPSGSTHCKHTAIYLISDRVYLSHTADPEYKLLSVVRECATAAVTRECTEASVGSLSFKKVTCTETCQGDGCNVGWPARPECITCSSHIAYDMDDYDQCLENPPMPAACSHPYHSSCIIHESGLEKGTRKSVEGYPRRITRGCSYAGIGNGCTSAQPRDTEIETCNRTCTTDGCNVGSGGLMPVVTLLTFLLPAAFGLLTQRYF